MTRLLTPALLLLPILLGSVANACSPTSSPATMAGPVYVVPASACIQFDIPCDEECGSKCVDYGGVFVETNGLAGLQRHVDETCGAGIDADVLVRDTVDWPMDD